jgi:hypothetical protein
MYRKVRQFKKYTLADVLLVIGLSIVTFVIGGICIGHGVSVVPVKRPSIDPIEIIIINYRLPEFFITGLISVVLRIPYYFEAVYLTWFLGVIIMVASLLGFASIIRWTIFKLLKKKR